MKNGKNPTSSQRNYIKDTFGLDPKNWLVAKWSPAEIVLVHRGTNATRTFPGTAA